MRSTSRTWSINSSLKHKRFNECDTIILHIIPRQKKIFCVYIISVNSEGSCALFWPRPFVISTEYECVFIYLQLPQRRPVMTPASLWMALDTVTARSLATVWHFSAIQATSCKVRTPSHACRWRTDSTGNPTLLRALVGMPNDNMDWILQSNVNEPV